MLLILIIFLLNLCEWYDYSVYLNLFSDNDSWLCFAIGYFFAPIGGLFSAILADKVSYIYSMALSALSMTTISIIYYLAIDIFVDNMFYLLFIIRCTHGFCIGGMMCLSFVELLKQNQYNKGFLASLPVLAMSIGLWLGENIVKIIGIKAILIYSLIALLSGIYLLVISNEKLNQMITCDDINAIYTKIHHSIRPILTSCGISSISALAFFFSTMLIEWEIVNMKFDIYYLILTLTSMLAGGILCNSIGIIRYFYTLTCLLSLCSIFIGYLYWIILKGTGNELFLDNNILNLFNYINNNLIISSTIIYLYIILIYMYMGAEALIHNNLYSPKYINVAMVVSYNLGACIFGSLTPYILRCINNAIDFQYFIYYIFLLFLLALYSIFSASKMSNY